MGKQLAPNYRGKGTSETKMAKNGKPKHAGNFSYEAIHIASLQSKDYHVTRDERGVLIVGDHTLLDRCMPYGIAALVDRDPFFESITRGGTVRINGKDYECRKTLTRSKAKHLCDFLNFEFIYREMIFTDGDFDYEFPNY